VSSAWTLTLWAVAGFLLIVMAVPTLAQAVQPLDDWFWELAVAAEVGVLVTASELLDVVGGAASTAILVTVVAAFLAWQRRGAALAVWLLVAAASQGLNIVIKEAYERPRPPLGLVAEHSWSFVSGHSLAAAALAITLVLVLAPASAHRRGPLVVAALYGLAMAASRVYLRAHWATDAIAGLAIGAATALTVVLIAEWWAARRWRSA
jgi:membrane-associated phospholipid phosphatase